MAGRIGKLTVTPISKARNLAFAPYYVRVNTTTFIVKTRFNF